MNFTKNELPTFVNLIWELVDEQDREVEHAIIGEGNTSLGKNFNTSRLLKLHDWSLMTREQREKHFKKVHQVNVLSNSTTLLEGCFQGCVSLPVSPEEFQNGLNVPLESIKKIWQKASQLLSDPSSISSAPGYSIECRMVASRSGRRPHLVTKTSSGKFSCDKECPNWKSIWVCSHCIAVAQVNGN